MGPKIYIAGPDVFRPDWPLFAQKTLKFCRSIGLEPLFPVPVLFSPAIAGVPGMTQPGTEELANGIFRECIDQIKSCDFVVANLTPFRGSEPDSGTVFEVGFAHAIGKPIVGYTLEQRLPEVRDKVKETKEGGFLDSNGFLIERFGKMANLMLDRSCTRILVGDIEKALVAVKECILEARKSCWRYEPQERS